MRRAAAIVVLCAFLAVAVAACGSESTEAEGVAGPSEVALEPLSSEGDNPFTPPVGEDETDIEPPPEVAQGGPTTFAGNTAGLYGGTLDYATCDAEQLVSYLEATPEKASAWADALSIQTTEISTYVDELTPVILRTDTRVTNHGYVDGVATPIPSLLQAGTAVFVNKYGSPVVKCYCGNPLTAALPLTKPTYTGTPWPGYRPGNVTIIQNSTTVINVFKLYDPDTGTIFTRPAGTSGGDDGPAEPEPEPEPTPEPEPEPEATTPPPEEPAPEPEPEAVQEQPSAYFDPQAGSPGDSYTLYVEGFEPNVTLDVVLTRPDGASESYSIETADAGTGQYTFPQTGGDTLLGTYTAVITNPNTGASTQAQTSVN